MRYMLINEPAVGCKYRSSDKEFVITDLPILDNDAWVAYSNIKTKEQYSCRLEAFLDRFSPTPG